MFACKIFVGFHCNVAMLSFSFHSVLPTMSLLLLLSRAGSLQVNLARSHDIAKCSRTRHAEELLCTRNLRNPDEERIESLNHKLDTTSFAMVHEIIPPETNPKSHEHSTSQKDLELKEQRSFNENNFSVLDLLCDGGSDSSLEKGSPDETHVTFSVKGFGKIGTETPAHAVGGKPRIFSNECLTPPKAAQLPFHLKSLDNILEDLDFEMNEVMRDFGACGGKPLKASYKFQDPNVYAGSSESKKFASKSLGSLGRSSNMTDIFSSEEDFEDTLIQRSIPCPEAGLGKGYFAATESWDSKSVVCQPYWWNLPGEDARDSSSLLSEESCSSSAVRHKLENDSVSSMLKLTPSSRTSISDPWENSRNFKLQNDHVSLNKNHGQRYIKQLSSWKKFPNLSKFKRSSGFEDLSAPAMNTKSKCGNFLDETCDSDDVGLSMKASGKSSKERYGVFPDFEFLSESECLDKFDTFPVSDFVVSKPSLEIPKFNHSTNLNMETEQEDLEPFGLYNSDISLHIQSHSCNKTPVAPYFGVYSKAEEALNLFGLDKSDRKTSRDIPDLQSMDCLEKSKQPEEDVTVEDTDLPRENQETIHATDFKSSCSECEETGNKVPDPSMSSKATNSPESKVEAPVTSGDVHLKPATCKKLNFLEDYVAVESQRTVQGMQREISLARRENSVRDHNEAEASYHMILESYVVQLLCMQKVIREGPEQDSKMKSIIPLNCKKVTPICR
ncbi:uncharacterized protein LOC110007075 [Amborella trichopoda]|uniref:uncharacterized protein LOC110007075 n=1 Tax=Amborella trichopoda TaxID=13333 RepID=UPI0009C04818|nr:uncharacterized protein LOC110007075 [Amborella trichopoda]|eukprot:XP_020521669.1 uncharacterized protein LOC110007075 [Amborella trichopoda]